MGRELDFDEFKQLVKPENGNGSSVHDVPIVGHFTYAFTKGFGDALGMDKKTDEELKAAFDLMDKDKGGTLDKGEIREALLAANKPEQEIEALIKGMTEDELTFDQFKELVNG